jgi:hypothetical protein
VLAPVALADVLAALLVVAASSSSPSLCAVPCVVAPCCAAPCVVVCCVSFAAGAAPRRLAKRRSTRG